MIQRRESIELLIGLDEKNMCESLQWRASQQADAHEQMAKAFCLSIWDGTGKGTLKIDLWNKEMDIWEMKRFCIETMATLADTLRRATGDELMAIEIENCCRRLQERLHTEMKGRV